MRAFLPLQWVLSLIFILQMYLALVIVGVVFLIPAMLSRQYAHTACRSFCRWVCWSLAVICGLRCEIRGDIPQHEVLIAAKHQSFLDIIMICAAVPRGRFIMKAELVRAPVLGWYALRIGCVPVDRGQRGIAILRMMSDVKAGNGLPGQMIIYPQGTRVAPGTKLPYKTGTAALYRQLGQGCVPAATNVGMFWPRRGILRKPGVAVVEFLPGLPPGLRGSDFMARIEQSVEAASDQLMEEARQNGA